MNRHEDVAAKRLPEPSVPHEYVKKGAGGTTSAATTPYDGRNDGSTDAAPTASGDERRVAVPADESVGRVDAGRSDAVGSHDAAGERAGGSGGLADSARPVASAAHTERQRVYMVKRTLVERCFYDPDEIKREFGEPDEGESWEDFVIRVYERFDGSIYGDEFFPGDASPEVGVELEERWDDE